MKRLIVTLAAFGVIVPAAQASSHWVKVRATPCCQQGQDPNQQSAGNQVKVYGVAQDDCKQGSTVTIYSKMFQYTAKHKYKGYPAIYTKVQKHSKFSTVVTIDTNVPNPKTYTVTARCNAETVGHQSFYVTQFYP